MAITASQIATTNTLEQFRTEFNNLRDDVSGLESGTISFSAITTSSITSDSIVFEGATDDAFETTLAVTDPTADRTITLPNETGTVHTSGGTTTHTAIVIGDGATIGSSSSTSAITVASTGIVTFVDDILIKDGGTIGNASVADVMTLASTGIVTFKDDIIIKDGGTIGTGTTAGAVTIAANGNVTLSGDLTISGDDLTMGTNTSGHLLIADGTNFNPTAVGDLSEISTIASDDVFLAVDTSGGGLKKVQRSVVVAGLATSSAISNIVEDTTPQLGGDLDAQGNDLEDVGVSSADTHAGIYGSSSSPVNFTVTVGSKTSAHPYSGDGSGNAYFINGVESPAINLHGVDSTTADSEYVYRFTLSSSDMSSHPFRLYLDAAKNTAYTTGVTTTSTYLQIAVDENTPKVLYYQCSSHSYMGNYAIILGSRNIGATTVDSLSVSDGNITNVGDIALDSISADATDINIAVTDNSATAFTIKQGSDNYLVVDTANSSESVAIGTGISGTAISIGHTTSETTVNDNLTVTGNVSVGGNLDVTGTFDLSDSNFTNAGDIQLDSITGDGDTDSSITFSGSDVITVATGGSTAATFNASQVLTLSGNLIIPDAGNIGSASDTDSIAIASDGVVTFSQKDVHSAGLSVKNGSTSAGFVEFFEDSDNGTNKVTLIGPASTADVTLTLPSATDTLATSGDVTALAIALG